MSDFDQGTRGRRAPGSAAGIHHTCLDCEHTAPPGIPGPCPDCGDPVLLWTARDPQPQEPPRITLLTPGHVVAWVEDIAIGPVLRATFPVHLCARSAALSNYQRSVIDWVWATGETTMTAVMKARGPMLPMTWAQGKAEIFALCPRWLEIVPPANPAARNQLTSVRYVGPRAVEAVEAA